MPVRILDARFSKKALNAQRNTAIFRGRSADPRQNVLLRHNDPGFLSQPFQGCVASRRMLSITHILTSVETSTVLRFASLSIMRLAVTGIRMFNCFVLG